MKEYILREIREGRARILIFFPRSKEEVSQKIVYKPVFYNPLMALSRTIDILVLRNLDYALEEVSICDLLSATGIRGIRYFLESNIDITEIIFNDKNYFAYNLIKRNAKRNNLKKFEVYNYDAVFILNFFRHIKKKFFSIIDIDPFGSPVYYIDPALNSIKNGGLIFVSSTDLAVLMGSVPYKCRRKYAATTFRASFSREIALRILLGYIAREAAKYDIIISPIVSYSIKHFVRTCVKIKYGKSKVVNKNINENIGYIAYCNKCGLRRYEREISFIFCPQCGGKILWGGPLWIRKIGNKKIVSKMIEDFKKSEYISEKIRSIILEILRKMYFDQENTQPYYTTEEFSSLYKVNEPKIKCLISNIEKKGYIATETHFSSKGFRTNAPLDVIVNSFLK